MNIPGLTNEKELSDLRERVSKAERDSGVQFYRRPVSEESGVPMHQVVTVGLILIAITSVVIWIIS